jgi:SAM-dependent methyltransferase
MAAVYDTGRRLLPEAEDAWADAVRGRVPDDALVVDVGAGTGRFSRLFAERFGARVVAVEPAARMRAAGTGHDAASVRRVRWVAGHGERLPLRAGVADVVWLSCVVHYLDLDAAGRELRHAVDPAHGRILVRSTFPDRFDELEWMRWFPGARTIDEVRMPSVERLQDAWARRGLRLEARIDAGHVIARDLHELADRLQHRAISTLEMISDAEFERGLTQLRAAADAGTPRPTYSAMDILSFVPVAGAATAAGVTT